MKSFNRHHLAMLPLLTILCSSPAVMESKFNNRSIASLAMIVESYPKLEAFRKNQAPESIQKDQDNSLEKFKLKRDALTEKIKKERESFKKDQSDKVIVGDQKKLIHSLATEVLVVEADLKDLQDRTLIESEEEASVKAETESKKVIESLLSDLEANEVLVAKADVPKVEEPKKKNLRTRNQKKKSLKKKSANLMRKIKC